MKGTKKPKFKNPFDLDGDQQDQIIVMESKKQSYNVINPIPFNPYPTQKQTKKGQQKTTTLKQTYQSEPPMETGSKPFNPLTALSSLTTLYTDAKTTQNNEPKVYELNEDGDPPLLQDIGIEPDMIKSRIIMILKLAKPSQEVIQDPDLSGPVIIALCFGFLLLLSGKLQFGDIYALFVVGNILLFLLFNFMSQLEIIPLYSIMSTVGYSLIPMLLLGFLRIFASMKGTVGIILCLVISCWSSLAASNFIEALMKQTNPDRKLLLIYPLFLFYVCFTMIIIF